MFDVDDIRDWRGLPVVDKDGGKIGKLEAVYFDTATEEPTFATVKVGLPGGGRLVFVPLDGARVSPQSVRVMTDKKTAKDAPRSAPTASSRPPANPRSTLTTDSTTPSERTASAASADGEHGAGRSRPADRPRPRADPARRPDAAGTHREPRRR